MTAIQKVDTTFQDHALALTNSSAVVPVGKLEGKVTLVEPVDLSRGLEG